MYTFVLILHNLLRWLVVVGAVYLLARVLPGLRGDRAWTRQEGRAAQIFTGLMDLQLLVGGALYLGVSPYMKSILDNFGAAMKGSETRFFAVEHVTGMLISVALAHVGNVLWKRQATDAGKFRSAALWFGLSLLCLLAFIPWWRPLLRL
ncbi:hypothetical protein MF271_05355 [Deinococcus sp. KNUC1210]|uniref:hypothetical protein n=1 Tax=Deinococcus sp. KNUC1210 TaxID=2917691 RepID=UPI001EF06FE5|nr:hypothetical protein [Deinococcus sp. KNUC1210]ULH16061.1 hypothetical protein MF271_05355 [Deinococcus sp. KNUC1210]